MAMSRKGVWATIVGVCILIGGLASVAQILGWFEITPTSGEPNERYAFVQPSPIGANPKVGELVAVSGTGTAPAGSTLIVGSKEEADDRIYFGQVDIARADNTWSGRMCLGDDRAIGRTFELHLVLIDKDLADYLATTNTVDGNTWWSSPGIPRGARIVATVIVERVKGSPCN